MIDPLDMEQIQFIGVAKLPPEQQAVVQKLSTEYYGKIKRSVRNLTSMVVHIKEYKKEGTRHKYSIHVRVICPSQIFESTKASDWELERVLHKSFKDVEREIQHQLHTDDQRIRME